MPSERPTEDAAFRSLWDGILNDRTTELPQVGVFGDFPDQVLTVTRTMMSILISVGKLEATGEYVLLPYVESKFDGSAWTDDEESGDDDGKAALFSEVLTFENAAFWVSNLVWDMRAAAEQLRAASGGETRVEIDRLRVARFYMALAAQQAITSTKTLHELIERYDGEKSGQGASSKRMQSNSERSRTKSKTGTERRNEVKKGRHSE